MAFALPKLFPNVSWTCPRRKCDLLDYLADEAPGGELAGGESVIEFQLRFVRTAKFNNCKFWLWEFLDEDGDKCYVCVRVDQYGRSVLGYDESFGLAPEQWLVMDYFDDWEN